MGGSVSAGRTNDELVDNLIEAGLIKSQQIELVFRAVDRGLFYLPEHRDSAYRDLAWREGLIHISAPCIYAKVMECLELRPSQYFLNIGSGSGYLSTMIGLILGSNGTNHNIELHQTVVDYSKQKVSEFIQSSLYFDDFDFCKPNFVSGNVLNLVTPNSMLYDRIYVGASVSTEHEDLIKNLLKINGICIMPLNDKLVKIKRLEEKTWVKNIIMEVSYASLITDNLDLNARLSLPKLQPYSLQELCRSVIRKSIRQSIESQNEDFYKIKRYMSTFNPNRESKRQVGISDDNDSENERMILSSRLLSRNASIDNRLRMMIYGHLTDFNNRLSVDLVDAESENDDSRALVLLRSNTDLNESNEEREFSPRETQDSGLSDESQSSSLAESCEPSSDQQKSSNSQNDCSNEEKKENLLRLRIMQLSLPVNVKKFVLYYRDI